MSAGVQPFPWANKAPRIHAEDLMKDAGCFSVAMEQYNMSWVCVLGGGGERASDSNLLPDKS
jgi:hypothetical protein